MADDFPIDVAQLVALFLESLFYGLYLVSFGMCMYSLLMNGKSARNQRYLLLTVALLLFTFATLDVAFLLRHVLDAFIWYKGPGGPIGELSIISYWVNVMKTVCYVAQTSIADAMLIYRCFIVYGSSWLVATPLIVLWMAGMATEGVTCYIEFTFKTDALLNTSQLTPFITSVLSITLVLNIIATFLIAFKIWRIQRDAVGIVDSRDGKHNGLNRAMRIIIESGIMYTVGVVTFFAVYMASNNAQYGVSDCVVQIIGISFNLIIIRVDQGRTAETAYTRSTGTTNVDSSHTTSGGPRKVVFAPRGRSQLDTMDTMMTDLDYGRSQVDVVVPMQTIVDQQEKGWVLTSEAEAV